MDEYLTVEDVSRIQRIGKKKAYAIVNQPDFRKMRIGNQFRIPKKDFEEFSKPLLYSSYP